MQQDELVRLFSHSLTFSQPPPAPEPAPVAEPEPQPVVQQQQPIRYISQHYTHSWHHAVPKSAPASVTCHTDHADSELENTLLRNDIDASSLSPSQIKLFRNADSDQRLRLVELWRISPPSHDGQQMAKELGVYWSDTTLQHEERLAEMRYEQLMHMRERQHHEQQFQQGTADDSGIDMGDSPVLHAANPVINYSLVGASSPEDKHAEPYILSGYEMLARREYEQQASRNISSSPRYNQALDPVYRGASSEKLDLQSMENQYGAFAQMREYSPPVHQPALHELDQEMVM